MRVLLGVCGGIAAYKACALTSALVQRGDEVEVVLTEDACRFVAPLTFAALTRRRAFTSLWSEDAAIAHIDLVRRADVFVIAPATANVVAKLALGLADDLLTTAALAARIPIVVAPAMNDAMYEHAATQEHLRTLASRGAVLVDPESGFLAEREIGIGRLAALERILAAVDATVGASKPPPARAQVPHALITAGPTREYLDPVRFLSNAASGATGIELAAELARRGGDPLLVLGPTSLAVPAGVRVERVTSAQEMHDVAVRAARSERFDFVVATAAVADRRPRAQAAQKLKKGVDDLDAIALEATPDVVAALREAAPEAFVVGFAAETQAHRDNAERKLRAKRLDAIAVNDVADGRAVGDVRNRLELICADDSASVVLEGAKRELATALLDALTARRMPKRRAP